MDNLPVPNFEELARSILSSEEFDCMVSYISKGGHPLAPDTAAKIYELFLNGTPIDEICKINKSLPRGSILHARIKFRWDDSRESYMQELHNRTKEKVIRAQLETTTLISDLLVAATKKHQTKIQKFLQTGNEADLGEDLNINSITNLLKLAEGLQKITGQDRTTKVKNEVSGSVNVINTPAPNDRAVEGNMSPETAAKILEILANESGK